MTVGFSWGKTQVIPGTELDPSSSLSRGLVMGYVFNGVLNDIVNNRLYTMTGATPPKLSFSEIGTVMSFDGSASSALIMPVSGMEQTTKSVAASLWINPTSFGSYTILFDNIGGGIRDFDAFFQASNTLYITVGNIAASVSIPTTPTKKWTHLVISYDDIAHVVMVYVNGQFGGSVSLTRQYTNPGAIYLGQNISGGGSNFIGKIANFFLYNRPLTTADAMQLYVNPYGMFLPPVNLKWFFGIEIPKRDYHAKVLANHNLIAYWRLGTSLSDVGPNNLGALSVVGTTPSLVSPGALGANNDDARTLGAAQDRSYEKTNPPTLLKPTGSFSGAMWIKMNDLTNTTQGLICRSWSVSGSDNVAFSWSFNGNGGMSFAASSAINTRNNQTSNNHIIDKDTTLWHHIAFSYTASGQTKLYLDGIDVTAASAGTNPATIYEPSGTGTAVPPVPFKIGANGNNGNTTQGAMIQIDNVALFSYALTMQEVADLYNSGLGLTPILTANINDVTASLPKATLSAVISEIFATAVTESFLKSTLSSAIKETLNASVTESFPKVTFSIAVKETLNTSVSESFLKSTLSSAIKETLATTAVESFAKATFSASLQEILNLSGTESFQKTTVSAVITERLAAAIVESFQKSTISAAVKETLVSSVVESFPHPGIAGTTQEKLVTAVVESFQKATFVLLIKETLQCSVAEILGAAHISGTLGQSYGVLEIGTYGPTLISLGSVDSAPLGLSVGVETPLMVGAETYTIILLATDEA